MGVFFQSHFNLLSTNDLNIFLFIFSYETKIFTGTVLKRTFYEKFQQIMTKYTSLFFVPLLVLLVPRCSFSFYTF